ncbi:MAG: hypothetical protein KAR19_12605 [Bacteroidales bacterium]|nr:hypothetical protein [Bacteroidales bacterium]
MRFLNEDDQYQYFSANFQDQPVRFMQDKVTGEIFIDSEDVANVLGFVNVGDMLNSDEKLMNTYLDEFKKGKIITTE